MTSQVKALSAHRIDVEICSGLTTSKEKNASGKHLNFDGYWPALIYTTSDLFFGHYCTISTILPQGVTRDVRGGP